MQWEDLAKVEQADQTVSSPGMLFRRGAGADLRRWTAQGVHEKAAGRLAREGRESLFFLVGENIPGNEELVRQMAKDGHLIGVHCMAHVDLARQPIEKSVEEIRETADWIEAVTGKTSGIHTSAVWFMEYGASGESVDDAGVLGRRYAGLEKPEYGADCEAYL